MTKSLDVPFFFLIKESFYFEITVISHVVVTDNTERSQRDPLCPLLRFPSW